MKCPLALVVLASPAFASTWIVDANGGPGSQFTDVGAAVVASAAGDVLVVRPGLYAPFTLDRGLSLVGGAGVVVQGPVFVIGVPGSERASLVGFQASELVVDACTGPVVVQEFHGAAHASFHASADVRLRDVPVLAPASATSGNGYDIDAARVEVVDSVVHGSDSTSNAAGGGHGVLVTGGGFAHVLATSLMGGAGRDVFAPLQYASGGGTALVVSGTPSVPCRARITGSALNAGSGAINWAMTNSCEYDGAPGEGAFAFQSTVWHSGTVVVAPGAQLGIHCIFFPGIPYGGSTHVAPTPDDPMLRVDGAPTQGGLITFQVYGPPGAVAGLWLGRSLRVQATPPTEVESLVTNDRFFALGAIPPSGLLSRNFVVPAYLPDGFVFGAQAEIAYSPTDVRRTNSAPVVVR